MIRQAALVFLMIGLPTASLAACGGVPQPLEPIRLDPPKRTLVLGRIARGDTTAPDRRTMSTCKNGGRAGQALDHLYGFQVTETATYRFELVPEFQGVIQVQQKHPSERWYFGIGCAAARRGRKAVVSVSLEPGLYWVVVDGDLWDEAGPYTLRVDVDRSAGAQIGSEDPKTVSRLVESAGTLRVGERAYGTFRSAAGGIRTHCGLLGGDAVKRLSLDRPMKITLRAAAHFPFALEVRAQAPATESLGCVRAAEGAHDAELTLELPKGDYVVVLDASKLHPKLPNFDTSGVVTGNYVIDAEGVRR